MKMLSFPMKLLFFLILFFCFFCFLFIFIITTKPKSIWSFVVDFLNTEEITAPSYSKTVIEVKDGIKNQIHKVGVNKIKITEEDLTILLQSKSKSMSNSFVRIENDQIFVFTPLDSSIQEKILYGVIGLSITQENGVEIAYLGTKRFSLPETAFTSILTDLFFNNINKSDFFLDVVFSGNKNLKINKIYFDNNDVILEVQIALQI